MPDRARRRPARLDDREWLRHEYEGRRRSPAQIAVDLGCSTSSVLAALKDHGVAGAQVPPKLNPRLRDYRFLYDQYVRQGRSLEAMAADLDCSYATVRRALLGFGIEVRRVGKGPIPQLRDRDWLRAQAATGRDAPGIAAELGCSEETVRSALQWAGLRARSRAPARPSLLDDPAFLEREYRRAGRTTRDLADELGCSKDAVRQALRRQGVPLRPRGERPATEAPEDRPTIVVTVPRPLPPSVASSEAAGTISPERGALDIDRIESRHFSVVRRGYDREEVDSFLQAVVAEHRESIRAANEAIRSANEAASGSHSFENVGSHVAAILATAAQAAEEMKAGAEREADAALHAAASEADKLRAAAEKDRTEAAQARRLAESDAASIQAVARTDAAGILDDAQRKAEQVEREAKAAAARAERIAQANVDAVVAEGRREYERLMGLQRQCVDRMTSAEFLIRQAREGLSPDAAVEAAADLGDLGVQHLAHADEVPDDHAREVRALAPKSMRRKAPAAGRTRPS